MCENSKLDIDFNIFDTDDMELLAFYNAEVYLELHELYSKLSETEVNINREDILKEVYDTLGNELVPIITNEKQKFEKIFRKTNRRFGQV